MQTVKIGNVEITQVVDTHMAAPPAFLFAGNLEQFLAENGATLDSNGLIPMRMTSFLIRSEGKNVLVDSGIGSRPRPGMPSGGLDKSLAAAGISPAEIDIVVHTHLHIDHVGWNTYTDANGDLRFFFPKAKHYIQQVEWNYWMTPQLLTANPHLMECVAPLAGSGRVVFQSSEQAIDENLVFVPTPGHTPGHVAIGIASAGERAIIVGDASHNPAQLEHPDWSPPVDVDPELAAITRAKLVEECAADGRTWFAGHWAAPGVGKIVRVDGKRVFQAL